jgi:glycosyltransferase involved in cell wall biosynthesis
MTEKQSYKVCMISCLHGLYDDRIYWKEALSLQKNGYEVTHLAVGDQNREFVSEHGIKLIEVARKRYFSNPYIDKIFRTITLRKNTNKQILIKAKEIRADVYHFHDLQVLKLIRRIKCYVWNPKIIYCPHESFPDMIRDYNSTKGVVTIFKNMYAGYIDMWELNKSIMTDHIVTVDDAVYDRFVAKFGTNKTSLIYNYTDIFPKSDKTEKKYDLIYVGGISEPRGIIQIIQAIEICKKKIPEIKFLLIGKIYSAFFRKRILDLIDILDLKDNIELNVYVPHENIEKFLSASKIGLVTLLPIPKYLKNIPIKQFEYMAFGLPVIGSNLPPIKNFIQPVDAGIIVDSTKPEDIAKAIIMLLTDEKLYNSLSKNATKAALEKYNWKFMENRLLQLYSNL